MTTTIFFTSGIFIPPILNGLTPVLCRALATRPPPRRPTNPLFYTSETSNVTRIVTKVWNEAQLNTFVLGKPSPRSYLNRQHNTTNKPLTHQRADTLALPWMAREVELYTGARVYRPYHPKTLPNTLPLLKRRPIFPTLRQPLRFPLVIRTILFPLVNT